MGSSDDTPSSEDFAKLCSTLRTALQVHKNENFLAPIWILYYFIVSHA